MRAPLLPKVVHRTSREAAAASQRDRLIVAMAETTAERGYAAATIAAVIAEAGVSRRTYYEHFDDKQACFLAAYDEGVRTLTAAIGERVMAAAGWRAQIEALVETYLELLAQEPLFAKMALVEIWAAGPEGQARAAAADHDAVRLLQMLQRQARAEEQALPEIDPLALEAAVGALDRIAVARILDDRTDELPQLAGRLAELTIAMIEGRA